MSNRGVARHAKITGKPMKGSKWNKAEIEPIVEEIKANPRVSKKDVAAKHGICYTFMLKKITDYHAGELK